MRAHSDPGGVRYRLLMPGAFVVMWASGAIAVESGLGYTTPATFLTLRAAGAAVVSWCVWWWVRDRLPRSRRQWGEALAVGLLLQVGYQGFFFLALSTELPAGMLAVIVGVQPVLTALMTRTGRSGRLWAGLLAGLLGLTMTVQSSLTAGSGSVAGVLFAVAALGMITGGTLLQSKSTSVGIWATLAVQTTMSTVVLTIVTLLTGQFELPTTTVFYLPLSWMVLVVSVGATALLYSMVTKHHVVRVSSLFYCVPPLTAGLDFLIFGTALTSIQLTGMALVMAAVALIQTARSTHETSPDPIPQRSASD